MRMVMDDDMLGRLVAYEKYVKKCFAQAARRRWRDMKVSAIRDYEQNQKYKNYISALVDLAFDQSGIKNGLVNAASTKQDPVLTKDLETLVAQLRWPSPGFHLPSPNRQFALVS